MKNHWIIYLFIICHVCGLIYGNLELTQSYASQVNLPDKHGYQSVVPGTEKHKYGYQLKTSGKHFHHTSTEKDGVRLGCYGFEVEGKQYVTQYVADARGYRLVTSEDQITVYPKFGAPEGKAQFGFRPFDDDDDAPRNVRYFFPKGCKGIDVQIDNSSRLRSLKIFDKSDKSAKLPVIFKPVKPDSYFYNTPPPNYPGPANIYAPNMIHVPTARPPLMVDHRPQAPQSTDLPSSDPTNVYLPPEQPDNTYLPPDTTTLAPEQPDNTYLPPDKPDNTYLPPVEPENTYLPPGEPENTYLPPEKPTNTYLPPQKPNNTYLPPQTPTNTYIPPLDSTTEVPASVDLVTDEPDNIPVDPLPEEPDNTYLPPDEPDNTYLPPNEPNNTYIPPPTPNNTYIPPIEAIPSTTEEIDLLPPHCPTTACCKDSLGKIVIPIKLKGQKSDDCCNVAKIILPIKYFHDVDYKKLKESLPEIDTNMIIRHILENLL
ncbi:platelet glycoprotein Ib alpha chain-like [Chironomus tepperi]|uniref:platelet glycoprotein Ib alpha chain-like n=1 Tax=Chironomus tepperi TaxID=113505 RepID=UPI00391F830A